VVILTFHNQLVRQPGDSSLSSLPLPPPELRKIVGPMDDAFWLNPSGDFFLARLPIIRTAEEMSHLHGRIFDFGCGGGRIAIQLMMQRERPREYCGIDINRSLIQWCQANLAPYRNFRFLHHEVFNLTYAPENSRNEFLPFPVEDGSFTLAICHSVFTHLFQGQTVSYLRELRRILELDGLVYSTWFFFNRSAFAALAPEQYCLFVNEHDPTQAVYYDWGWFCETVKTMGFKIAWVDWTKVSGFQTCVFLHKGNRYPDIGNRLVPPSTVVGY
jgi:SAM-dependent methyltransferase